MNSEPLKRYMATGLPADLPDREYLKEVAWRYPWFRLPSYLLAEYDRLKRAAADDITAATQEQKSAPVPAAEPAPQDMPSDAAPSPDHRAIAVSTIQEEVSLTVAEKLQDGQIPRPATTTATDGTGETEETIMPENEKEDNGTAPSPEEDRIEAFLRTGPHRITATDDTPEQIDGIDMAGYDDDDLEFATEELAEIYLEQGLKSMALDIYGKLCLVYPEKSVYFAELIAEIKGDNN